MNKESHVAIHVDGVSKTFKLPHEKQSSMKGKLLHFRKAKRGYETQKVLDDITFEVKKGEFFGIVGRNGSGKSTLLKTIAQIYTPDKGGVQVNGTLVPFIELGVGFNPELTGRENVFLNGALLGFSRKQMAELYDDIVEFAELEKFMDQKLKNYSSGMQVRLAFSIAIRAKGDILLLDEVLAVGDSAFQQKCFSYFHTLKEAKKTVILVTHSMSSFEKFCDKGLLLEKGKVVKIGPSVEIADLYNDLFIEDANKKRALKSSQAVTAGTTGKGRWDLEIVPKVLIGKKEVNVVKHNRYFTLRLNLVSRSDIRACNVGINIRDERDQIVFSTDTRLSIGEIRLDNGKTAEIEIKIFNQYTNGKYYLDLHAVDEDRAEGGIIFKQRRALELQSMGVINHAHSMFHPKYEVRKV